MQLVWSCKEETIDNTAFISGEIVNPVEETIILFRQHKPIDTAYLNDRNRFVFRLEENTPIIINLKHGPYSQMMHVAPGDSILMRVNTRAYTESVHFSGKGGEKNNFLINQLLRDRANSRLIVSYYKMKPEIFSKKIDSIKNDHLKRLEALNKNYNFSSDFLELAKTCINYNIFDLQERYTYMTKRYKKDFNGQFPSNFHDYRKKINFNKENIQVAPCYNRLIEDFLINKVIASCQEKNGSSQDCFSIYTTRNIIERINLLDQLTDLPHLEQHLFLKLGAQAMTSAKTWEETRAILKVLEKKEVDMETLENLKRLALIQTAFMPGIIPRDIPFVTNTGEKILVQNFITQPTIIFIWSIHSPSKHEKEHNDVAEYRKKYPEINFIGINVDMGEITAWQNTLKRYGYNPEMEYQLGEISVNGTSIKKDLYNYYLNKMAFLNANGEIIVGDAMLRSPDFESRILSLLNQ